MKKIVYIASILVALLWSCSDNCEQDIFTFFLGVDYESLNITEQKMGAPFNIKVDYEDILINEAEDTIEGGIQPEYTLDLYEIISSISLQEIRDTSQSLVENVPAFDKFTLEVSNGVEENDIEADFFDPTVYMNYRHVSNGDRRSLVVKVTPNDTGVFALIMIHGNAGITQNLINGDECDDLIFVSFENFNTIGTDTLYSLIDSTLVPEVADLQQNRGMVLFRVVE